MHFRAECSKIPEKLPLNWIVIEGLKQNFDKDDGVRNWLRRYGTVEGKLCYVLAFFYKKICFMLCFLFGCYTQRFVCYRLQK